MLQSKALIKNFNQKLQSKRSTKWNHSGPHNTTPREDMSNKVSIITHLFSGSPLRDLVISNIWYASLSRYHDPSVSNLSVVLFAWSWMIMLRSWVFSTIYRYFCATLKTETLVQTSWYWKKNANSLFVHCTLFSPFRFACGTPCSHENKSVGWPWQPLRSKRENSKPRASWDSPALPLRQSVSLISRHSGENP